jgi:hypothetical protein
MQSPNFFIVGAPRCATTAMQCCLTRHPDIYLPSVKESHHFATDLLRSSDHYRSLDNYLALFKDVSKEYVVGEASVYYLYSKHAAQNIYNFNSQAKIIVMLRNPSEMIVSYHSELLYKGDEYISDLHLALAAEEERRRGNMLPKKIRFNAKLYYSEILHFSEQLKRYVDRFGSQSVHIIIYDDLKANPPSVLTKTLEFLGVDPLLQSEFSVVNSNKRVRSARIRDLLKDPPKTTKFITKAILPRTLRRNLHTIITKLNRVHESRPALLENVRSELQRKFAKEVETLSQLINRDLTSWNRY